MKKTFAAIKKLKKVRLNVNKIDEMHFFKIK